MIRTLPRGLPAADTCPRILVTRDGLRADPGTEVPSRAGEDGAPRSTGGFSVWTPGPGSPGVQAAGSGTTVSGRFPRASDNNANWANVDPGLSSALPLSLLRHMVPAQGSLRIGSTQLPPSGRPAGSRPVPRHAGAGQQTRVVEEDQWLTALVFRAHAACGREARWESPARIRAPSGELRTFRGSEQPDPLEGMSACRVLPS